MSKVMSDWMTRPKPVNQVAYRIGTKTLAGYPIMLTNLGFPTEAKARQAADAMSAQHGDTYFVFKVTTEEI